MRQMTLSAVFLTMLAAPALAKGHDQSGTMIPGENVGVETVGAAQTLGAALGNGKGPQGSPGKSGSAGAR